MKKIIESIFDGETTIIPMADVQHIEKRFYNKDASGQKAGDLLGIIVVTKHTKWDYGNDGWANNIWLTSKEAERFIRAWRVYRHEIEV